MSRKEKELTTISRLSSYDIHHSWTCSYLSGTLFFLHTSLLNALKMHSFKLTIFAMAAAVKDVLAWDLKDPILSCADVSCPYDGVNPTCTVVNDTFIGVGIVPIPDLPDVLSGTSLIKAVGLSQSDDDTQNVVEVRASDTIGPNTTFRSAYYLGTPASLDPSKLSGCLVVFHDNRDGLHFNSLGDVPNIEMDTGFCADVISQDCTNELQNMAMEAMEHTESCRALDQMLQNTPTKSCDDFAGLYRGLGSYTVVDASNLSPITKEDNSTSDCWPVFPKEAQLSSVLIEQATVSIFRVSFTILELC